MSRHGRPGAAHRVGALALACLTGCYTTTARTRIARDHPEHVETRPNGTHLDLAAVEPEPGRVVVAAREHDMCQAQERGQRTYDLQLHQTKGDLPSGGGGHPVLILLAPLFILIAIIHLASPEHTVTVQPTEEPAVPYTAWRGARAPCGGPPRPAPGVPLVLAVRQSGSRCAGWSVTTGPDGLLPLAEVLDPATAAPVSCAWQGEDGGLLVEGAPGGHRTSDQLRLPAPPGLAAALADRFPEAPGSGRASFKAEEVEALRTCASHLSPACLEELEACDREAEEKGDVPAARALCAFATLRCEPRTPAFDGCTALIGRPLAGAER